MEKARHLSFVATKTKQTLLKHAFALTMQNFIRNYEFMQNYCYCTIFLERNKLVVPKIFSFIYCIQVQFLSFIVRVNDSFIDFYEMALLLKKRENVKKNDFFGTLSQTMGRWGSKVPNFRTLGPCPKIGVEVQSPKQIHGILSEKLPISSKKNKML